YAAYDARFADCAFLFARRRRHARFSRDWSSDVCSSDLRRVEHRNAQLREVQMVRAIEIAGLRRRIRLDATALRTRRLHDQIIHQIGRASCRERGWSRATALANTKNVAHASSARGIRPLP